MSLELISLVTAVIGLLMIAVPLETNGQTDQPNITNILKPNATLTDLQKSAMAIKLLLMPNTIHFALHKCRLSIHRRDCNESLHDYPLK